MEKQFKLEGLDATRFWAALLITFYHLTSMPGLPPVDDVDFIRQQFGRIAVPLFFTTSAFALFFGYFRNLGTKKDVNAYLLRRFFRIAPLFYIMICIYTAFLYYIYGHIVPFEHIFSSLLFIFNLSPKLSSGFVWASWSIGVEMLFYILLPILVAYITDARRALAFLVVAMFLSFHWTVAFSGSTAPLANYGHFSLIAHIQFFAGGIVGYFAFVSVVKLRKERAHLIGAVALVAALAIFIIIVVTDAAALTSVGLAGAKLLRTVPLALFVFGIALNPVRLFSNSVTVALGKTSFSLYLLHPLVIGLLMHLGVYNQFAGMFTRGNAAIYIGMVAMTLGILIPAAVLSYRYIERPGMRLYYRFDRGQPVPTLQRRQGSEASQGRRLEPFP